MDKKLDTLLRAAYEAGYERAMWEEGSGPMKPAPKFEEWYAMLVNGEL